MGRLSVCRGKEERKNMNLFCSIYLRVSETETRGSSLADQERICRAFAAAQGMRVARVYRDDGKSAWRDEVRHRPQFEQLLAAARHPRRQFSAVIVFKLDRFARKARIYHTCRWELERAGVQLLSASEPNDSSAAGRLSSGMLAEFAEFYSAQLSERIKASTAGRRARGEWVGPAPFGYELRGRQLVAGRLWWWVVVIFLAYRAGYTTVEIGAGLRAAGVPLSSGRPWSKDSVLMVLRNHAYIGRAGGRALEAYEAGHKPLITLALWEEVQQELETRRKRPRGPLRRPKAAPLPWRPICAACGAAMHRHPRAAAVYLHCRGAVNKTCKAGGVRLDLVEHQVELLEKTGARVAVVWLRAPRGIERFE